MILTLAQPINTAIGILNDLGSVRYSRPDLLQYANDALDQMVVIAAPLFNTEGEVECIPDSTIQSVSYGDAHALVDIRRIKNGTAITPCDRASLDAYNPDWHNPVNAGFAQHWMPLADDPVRFLIYPPAPSNQVLDIIYTRIPDEYTETEDVGLPDTYSDAIADYIVHRASSRDAEHVNSGRAAQFLASFISKVKGA
jgi:hypothetical protein